MGLYVLGLLIAILVSSIFEKTLLKSKGQSFILEFPSYRLISFKKTLSILWQNVKTFVIRVGSGILAMNVVVFILSNFSFSFNYIPSGEGSILESLGKILAPIFIPLGFGKWQIASSLASGVVAKEVILSSILMFSEMGSFTELFVNRGAVLSFLVFTLLYCPCLSTMMVLKQEIGWKWTLFGIAVQFFSAYLISFFIYSFYSISQIFEFGKILVILFVLALVLFSIFYLVRVLKHNKCPYSSNCRGCKKR